MKEGLLGLDVGSRRVHVVDLSGRPEGCTIPRDPDDDAALIADLRALSQDRGWGGRGVVVSIGSGELYLVPAAAETATGRPDRAWEEALLARPEVADGIPVDGALVDCWLPRSDAEPGGTLGAIVAAAPREAVERRIAIADAAGWQIRAVEPDVLALVRLAAARRLPEDITILHVRQASTCLVVVGGGRAVFARYLDGGEDDLLRRMAGVLGVEPEAIRQALAGDAPTRGPTVAAAIGAREVAAEVIGRRAMELRRTLLVYKGSSRTSLPGEFTLTGTDLAPILGESLAEPLGMAFRPWEPVPASICAGDGCHPAGLAVAAGLALRAAEDGSDKLVDLLPEDRRYDDRRLARWTRKLEPLYALPAVLLLAIACHAALWIQERGVRGEKEALEAAVAELEPYRIRIGDLERARGALGRQSAFMEGVAKVQKIFPAFLKELSRITPAGVWFRRIQLCAEGGGGDGEDAGGVSWGSLERGPRRLTLRGLAPTPRAVSDLMRKMQASKLFLDVEPKGMKQMRHGGRALIEFTVQCALPGV